MPIFEQKSDYSKSDYRSRNYSGVWQKRFVEDYVRRMSDIGLEAAVAEMADFKNEHLPRHLYKFFRPSIHSLISLENQKLWLTTPRTFNDPFDSYVCIEAKTFEKEYILNELQKMNLITKDGGVEALSENEVSVIKRSYSREQVSRAGVYPPANRVYYDAVLREILLDKNEDFQMLIETLQTDAAEIFRKIVDEIRDADVKVTCFSNFENDEELAKNITMWSHYAENHTGFCVRYSLERVADFVKTGLLPVKYTSNVPKLSVLNLLRSIDKKQKLAVNRSIAKSSRKALITKSTFWNYEKEWRLMVESERVDLFMNNCIAFPYVEAIFLGCRIDNNLKYHLASFAEENNLEIFETRQSEERFVLDFYPTSVKRIKNRAWYDEFYRNSGDGQFVDEQELRRERLWRIQDIIHPIK